MFVESEVLTTERLTLRPYGPADVGAFVAMATDPDVMRYVGDGAMSDERARRVAEKAIELTERGAWGIWAVLHTATGDVVGSAEIKPRQQGDDWEIVYLFAKRAWGKGYATEVGNALVRFGLERMDLPRVTATVDFSNAPSIRVLEKLGMRFLGEERDEDGAYAVYGVERTERE